MPDTIENVTVRTMPRWLWFAAVALLALVFLLTSPDDRHEAEDAYDYAAAVEFGQFEDLLYPHHLLYLPLVDAIYEPTHALGIVDRPLPLMVILGSIVAAVTCLVFVWVLREWLEVRWSLATSGGAFLAASYGFWRYAGEAEVYALAALAAVLLLLAAISLRPTLLGVTVISALVSLAILAHVLNASLVLALPYLLYHRGWRLPQLTRVAAAAGVLLLVLLFGAYQYSETQGVPIAADGFLAFYLGTGGTRSNSLMDLVVGIPVLAAAIGASNFVYLFAEGRDLLESLFPGMSLAEQFVMGTTAPGWLRWTSLVTGAMLVVGAVILFRNLRIRSFLGSPDGKFVLVWLLGYLAIVFLAGNPRAPEGWLLILVPFWIVVVGSLRTSAVRKAQLMFVVAALAAHSLVGGFLPLYLGEDRLQITSAWLSANAGSYDLVVTADSSVRARYIAYQTPAYSAHIGVGPDPTGDVLQLAQLIEEGASTVAIITALDPRLSGHRDIPDESGRLYVTADMFDPPSWLRASNPDVASELIRLEDLINQNFTRVASSDYLVRTDDIGRDSWVRCHRQISTVVSFPACRLSKERARQGLAIPRSNG